MGNLKIAIVLVCLFIGGNACNSNYLKTLIVDNTLNEKVISSPLAFPSAEGYGAQAIGGRGGKIIYVTNLNDSGIGSFRDAVNQNEPRIIVFSVGGIIELTKDIDIKIPYITIAGQTALGDGICVKNAGILIRANDVIIRNLCSRPGDSIEGSDPNDRDAFKIIGGYNIILDHVSASWAIDEGISIWYSPYNITIQWSIISENLHNSLHPKGKHSMGLLIGETTKNISIHHNIIAHNNQRSPLVKTGLFVDIVNNIVYNWGDYGTGARGFIGGTYGDIEKPNSVNIINNYYKTGPSTKGNVFEFERLQDGSIFIDGNIGNAPLLIDYNNNKEWYISNYPYLSAQQFFAINNINIHTASEFYSLVLEKAGVSVPKRSDIDARIVNDAIQGTGNIIDSPSDVGGYSLYETGVPLIDSDMDGMPDFWEIGYGLDPNNPLDGNQDSNNDGYTNIEEYLNELVGD